MPANDKTSKMIWSSTRKDKVNIDKTSEMTRSSTRKDKANIDKTSKMTRSSTRKDKVNIDKTSKMTRSSTRKDKVNIDKTSKMTRSSTRKDKVNIDKTSTPASNLGYLAPPPQDNFSWVPKCSLGPPGWERKVSSKKFWFGLCEIAWFLCQPIANLRRGVCL